jgi:hypothetical protein
MFVCEHSVPARTYGERGRPLRNAREDHVDRIEPRRVEQHQQTDVRERIGHRSGPTCSRRRFKIKCVARRRRQPLKASARGLRQARGDAAR